MLVCILLYIFTYIYSDTQQPTLQFLLRLFMLYVVAVRPRPVPADLLMYSGDKKHTPERIEYVTESEMEESEFETAQHNQTASIYGSSSSDEESSTAEE